MKPTTEILARISQNSLANKEEVFTKLYRYLLRPDIYFVAYKNLYANNGAATKGVNEDTADGFSEAKIDSIIKALADETYQPMPVRRTYIQKKNNRKKLRPFDSFCKKVLKCEAYNGYREISRKQSREVAFSELPEDSMEQLASYDRYPWEYTFFPVGGDVILIEDDRLAEALNALPQDGRDILLMYFFLDMADREIAERMNMARRTVNARRQKAYRLLKELMGGDVDG